MQGVVQTQNGDSGSQLGKPSARNQRRLFSKVLPQDAGQPSSSSACERGWGWPQSTQGRNRKLLAPWSRSKGHVQSRARLRSQFCSQLKGTGTLPLRHLGGGWSTGVGGWNLQPAQSGPAQVGPFPAWLPTPHTGAESPEKHSWPHLEANDISGTSMGCQQANHWVSASVTTQGNCL